MSNDLSNGVVKESREVEVDGENRADTVEKVCGDEAEEFQFGYMAVAEESYYTSATIALGTVELWFIWLLTSLCSLPILALNTVCCIMHTIILTVSMAAMVVCKAVELSATCAMFSHQNHKI